MAKTNGTNIFLDWLKSNFITLVVLTAGMILAWAALNARVAAIESKIAKYPSQDWFELKFQNIDNKFADLEDAVNKKADKVAQSRPTLPPPLLPSPTPTSLVFRQNTTYVIPDQPSPSPTTKPKPQRELINDLVELVKQK